MRILNHAIPSASTRYSGPPKSFNTNHVNFRMEFNSTFRERTFWRDGKGVAIGEHASWNTGEEALFITIEYEIPIQNTVDLNLMVDDLHRVDETNLRKEIMQAALHAQNIHCHTSIRKFQVHMKVTRDDLDQAGGVIYLQDLDLIFGLEKYKSQAMHPYTQPGMLARMKENLTFDNEGTNVRFILVDNTNQAEPIWYNNGIRVFKINPIRNSTLSNGLYVFSKEEGSPEITHSVFTLENIDKQGIFFRSKSEAQNYGKPELALDRLKREHEERMFELKRDIAEREMSFKETQQRFQEEKEEYKRQKEQDDREYQLKENRLKLAMQQEQHLLDIRTRELESKERAWKIQHDAEYEHKARGQKLFGDFSKNTIEVIKGVLAVISSIVVIVATIKGIPTPKK